MDFFSAFGSMFKYIIILVFLVLVAYLYFVWTKRKKDELRNLKAYIAAASVFSVFLGGLVYSEACLDNARDIFTIDCVSATVTGVEAKRRLDYSENTSVTGEHTTFYSTVEYVYDNQTKYAKVKTGFQTEGNTVALYIFKNGSIIESSQLTFIVRLGILCTGLIVAILVMMCRNVYITNKSKKRKKHHHHSHHSHHHHHESDAEPEAS